jgi:hypothetical protein
LIIKSKNSKNIVSDIFSILKKIKLRNYLITVFFALSISIVGLGGIYYGTKLKGSEYSSVFASFYRYFRPSTENLTHLLKGYFSKPEKLDIHIKHVNYEKLSFAVNEAKKRGMILSEDKSVEVNGKLNHNNNKYNVELKIRGTYLDHVRSDKWSFRIKVKDDKTFFGMKRFSISSPETRNHIHEWLFQQALKSEGLINLRYKFVDVSLNGKSLGIYALEEFFDKRLIENNKLREGLIVKPNYINEEKKVFVYQEKNTLKDSIKMSSYELLNSLLISLKENQIKVESIFDIDKTAKYFALTSLFGGQHGHLKENFVCYFNPITNLLEPIGYDSNVARKIERYGGLITSKNNLYHPSIFEDVLLKKLFESNYFYVQYINNLNRIANDSYYNELFAVVNDNLNKNLNILYKEYPYFSFLKHEYLKENINYIENQIHTNNSIKASIISYDGKNRINLSIDNFKDIPIKIIGLEIGKNIFFEPLDQMIISSTISDEPKYLRLYNKKSKLPNEEFLDFDKKLIFKIVGLNEKFKINVEDVNFRKIFDLSSLVEENFLIKKESNIDLFSFLEINYDLNEIIIKNGSFIIENDLIIPPDFKLIVESGARIDIINKSNILSYSTVLFEGTESQPINIFSSDNTGQGITVINASEKSLISHVNIKNLSNPNKKGIFQTGSINFYQSDVEIKNSLIENNYSEDALNIFRSDYNISNTIFNNSFSDAFDGDFSNGNISNSKFYNCGNDAIDVSGSFLNLDSIIIDKVGDKAISIGENSNLVGSDLLIENCELAITSKDRSFIKINNIVLNNNKVDFTAYEKKSEFGSSKIIVNNYKSNNLKTPFLIEIGSSLYLDNKEMPTINKKVEDLLYGTLFGKSSK